MERRLDILGLDPKLKQIALDDERLAALIAWKAIETDREMKDKIDKSILKRIKEIVDENKES